MARIGKTVMSLCLAAGLAACKSDPESTGLGGTSPSAAAPQVAAPRHEPALESPATSASKKLFRHGLLAIRHRDFSSAAGLFAEAERQHGPRAGDSGDDFIFGCIYYQGLCQEALFSFDGAREFYKDVPQTSAYHPRATRRLAALTDDSDGDGYADAWEEAEGTNPQNPLSHP